MYSQDGNAAVARMVAAVLNLPMNISNDGLYKVLRRLPRSTPRSGTPPCGLSGPRGGN